MKRLILLGFVIMLNACGVSQNSEKPSEAEHLQEGFEMVDQGRYDDALLYFQSMYEAKPSDDILKAWASVYVARAGVKVSTIYEAFASFPKDNFKDEKLTKENIVVKIQAYKTALDKIPYVRGDDRIDLQSATHLLQARNSSTVRLFRAILNLVLLRSTFSDGDKILMNTQFKMDLEKDLKTVCKLEWKKLKSWIQGWTYFGIELKQDLDFAYPSKKKDWKDSEKFFNEARNFSTIVIKACNP